MSLKRDIDLFPQNLILNSAIYGDIIFCLYKFMYVNADTDSHEGLENTHGKWML